MKCTLIPGVGFICGPSPRRKRCASCGQLCDLECDAPIKRKPEADRKWTPKVGDARVHLKRWRIYYVHAVKDPGGLVTLADEAPGFTPTERLTFSISWDDWYERLAATCNRPVCKACRVRFGQLDFCAVHGRQVQGGLGWPGRMDVLLAERGRDLFEILQSR